VERQLRGKQKGRQKWPYTFPVSRGGRRGPMTARWPGWQSRLAPLLATVAVFLVGCPRAQLDPGTGTRLGVAGTSHARSGKVFTVVAGREQAVIVGSGQILQSYIEQSTGRKLALVAENDYKPETMPPAIFVGDTAKARALFGKKLETMDQDGYIVHVSPSFVVLVGASPLSTTWAQYDFLRTYLGIDSYLPNKLFTIVPGHEVVRVPVGTRIEVPVFLSRDFSGLNTNNGLRSQPDIPWRFYRRYAYHHNIHTFITVEEFGKDHPEYFPEVNGKRVIVSSAAGPGPCISNPEVVAIVIRKCREFFDKNPAALTVSLGMTDGGYCECANCRAMDGPSAEVKGRRSERSNRYYTFVNQVAKALQQSHPGKYVGLLGYAGADVPPSFPIERNIITYLCYNRANWADPKDKAADLALIDAWMKREDRIGIYEYLYGLGFSVPRIYSHRLADMLRYVGKHRPGSGFYCEIYSHHGLDGPKAWVTEKLLWNPNQDVDRLMEQWSRACFGPAWKPMNDYFALLENIWLKNSRKVPQTGKFWGYQNDQQFKMFLPDDMPPLWALLDQAKAMADTEVVRQRIDYFASTLKVTDVSVRQYHAYNETMELVEAKAEPAKVLASLVKADRNMPDFDLQGYVAKLIAEDSTKLIQCVDISRPAQAAQYVFDKGVWPEVRALLKAGERDRAKLVKAAQDAVLRIAPAGYENEPAGKARIQNMLELAERFAVAKRVEKPPTIDGTPDEPCYRWVEQTPWFKWPTGTAHPSITHFALAYDDESLYVAVRCPQPDLAKFLTQKAYVAYGCPAWKFLSVEIFLSPDEHDAEPKQIPYYQVIPTATGGLWESGQNAMTSYKVTNNGRDLWQAEIAISWKKLNMDPRRFPCLRMNIVRNVGEQNDRNVAAWFVSAKAHNSPSARGWLLLD